MAKKVKLPADVNKRAKAIVDIATGEIEAESIPMDEVQKAASVMGKKGGKAGGIARAAKLSDKRKSAIARKAAKARWGHKED